MVRKLIVPVLLIAVLMLSGCVGTIHGGGTVSFFEVETGNGPGQPTEASVAVTVNCNDARDMVSSVVHVTDNTNGANFTARLPWTPISALFGGDITTCEEAQAIVDDLGFSLAGGVINSKGQQSGQVVMVVSVSGAAPDECGDLQGVGLQAYGTADVLPGGYYQAAGCLDHGKIVFQ